MLLVVAKIRPGGTAAGVVKPGDVLLGCSLLVNVEDDDGEFTEELRWHDATAHGPEHTLTMLLTHGEEMNVRTCRGYVVKRDKAIRSAWALPAGRGPSPQKRMIPVPCARMRTLWGPVVPVSCGTIPAPYRHRGR